MHLLRSALVRPEMVQCVSDRVYCTVALNGQRLVPGARESPGAARESGSINPLLRSRRVRAY